MSTESTGSSSIETAAVTSALETILQRLDQLEAKIDAATPATSEASGPIAVAKLHDPQVQQGLGRILDRLDKVEAMVDALGTFGERLPAIGDALGTVARMGYDQAKERGIDPVATGRRALDLGMTAASPATFDLFERLLAKQGTVMALLDAVEDLSDDDLASVGTALVETYGTSVQMAGPLKALFALGDPDVMRTVGFTLEFARRLGKKLDRS